MDIPSDFCHGNQTLSGQILAGDGPADARQVGPRLAGKV
jgi:hypothetical protein